MVRKLSSGPGGCGHCREEETGRGLTDVQGHALLGVRLQLVVVDGHLPLRKHGRPSEEESPGPQPVPREACPGACGPERMRAALQVRGGARPWGIGRDGQTRSLLSEPTAWQSDALPSPTSNPLL